MSIIYLIFLIASLFTLVAFIVVGSFLHKKNLSAKSNEKGNYLLTPFQVFIVGFFICAAMLLYPIYFSDYFFNDVGFVKVFKSILLSIHNAMRLFILDGDFEIIKNTIGDTEKVNFVLGTIYSAYSAVIFVAAPVLTAGVVLSFFKDTSALIKYYTLPKSDIYVMSELNERSVALAEDIITNSDIEGRKIVIFADVFEKAEEENFELVAKARRLGAICFKKDITEVGLRTSLKNVKRKLFFLSDNEDENLKQALVMITRCKENVNCNTHNTEFYVFSTSVESEALVNMVDNGNMKVRRVKQSRSLALNTLCNHSIFDDAIDCGNVKKISVIIVGLGGYGTELLKAICWCGQMVGYELKIHAFDEGDGEAHIRSIAPELVLMNDCKDVNENQYEIVFHNNVDAKSAEFIDEIKSIDAVGEQITTVYVTLGDDELNIETAMRLRTQFGRDNMSSNTNIPPIFAVVYSPIKNDIFSSNGGLRSFRGTDYGIGFIGSMKERYSLDAIEQRAIEEEGLKCHLKWSNTSDEVEENKALYEKYEYYRRSSISEAIHTKFRNGLGIIPNECDVPNEIIALYEHRRWNAYIRAEGYVFGLKKDDIAKTHPDLIPYDKLSKERRDIDHYIIAKWQK